MSLIEKLFSNQDLKYRAFLQKLIPNIDGDTIIGVRTPQLRRLAREMENQEFFLDSLPHTYFEENQIHDFLLEQEKDFDTAILRVKAFLPYVDNWATCDQLRPKAFSKNRKNLLPFIQQWLTSSHPYTIRFGIEMLMCHYLDEDFKPEYLEWVSRVDHQDYYVKMMVSWYFATALAKQYDSAIPYITEHRLEPWTHNKAIQKAVESYRITSSQKNELKLYRI